MTATAVDRTKYLDDREVNVLRTVTEAHAITDLQAGRYRGVLAWAVVDVALQTGLRASELVRLIVGDFDPKASGASRLAAQETPAWARDNRDQQGAVETPARVHRLEADS